MSSPPPPQPPPPLGPPPSWLGPLARFLGRELPGSVVEGIAGGSGWLSLRLSGRFLWLTTLPSLRAVWLDEHPMPGAWLHALGRHKESPFAGHLEQRRIGDVLLMAGDDGQPCGLSVALADAPALKLQVTFWPRPGAIWLDGGHAEPLARTGDGPPTNLTRTPTPRTESATANLELPDAGVHAAGVPDSGAHAAGAPHSASSAAPEGFEPAQHAAAARARITALLLTAVRKRVHDVLAGVRDREQRRITAIGSDLHDAHEGAALRARADVLAANLHALPAGRSSVTLTGFDGQPVTLTLDPRLTPARNLDAMYKRAGRSERKLEQASVRLIAAQSAKRRADEALAELQRRQELDDLLDLAVELGIDFAPVRAGEHRSRRSAQPQERLPYRVFLLASGLEVRVGRSATDNDALTRHHSAPHDLWLHAQGAQGSHVILRTEGRPTPARDTEQAAQLAALFSRARTSQTVPVVVTERRYVRKPRGAAAGLAVAERAKTLFVTPGMPEGCTQQGAAGGD